MHTETFLRIHFSVIGRCSLADLSLAAGRNAQELTSHSGFRYDFTDSHAAFCKNFQCQQRRFRVFEEEIS
jgi:hypothetical protein